MASEIYMSNFADIPKKPVNEQHGENTLFQRILGRGTDNPDLMQTFQGVSRITIPPGGSNKVHAHETEEQIYIILRGKGIVEVGGVKANAKAGDVVYIPPRITHGFHNSSDNQCIVLNIGARVQPLLLDEDSVKVKKGGK